MPDHSSEPFIVNRLDHTQGIPDALEASQQLSAQAVGQYQNRSRTFHQMREEAQTVRITGDHQPVILKFARLLDIQFGQTIRRIAVQFKKSMADSGEALLIEYEYSFFIHVHIRSSRRWSCCRVRQAVNEAKSNTRSKPLTNRFEGYFPNAQGLQQVFLAHTETGDILKLYPMETLQLTS
jgi:hypothetical protein